MAEGIKDKVAIIGMGCTKFGERWDVGSEELIIEAFNNLDKNGNVETIAGTGQKGNKLEELNKPAALLVHEGNLWIADLNNHQIKVLSID